MRTKNRNNKINKFYNKIYNNNKNFTISNNYFKSILKHEWYN